MAIVLKPKKSETASAVPTTSDLAVGEICMNIADRKIYTRKSDNSIVVVGSHVDATVGGDLSGTVSNAQIAANSVGIAELNVADGSNLQVLTTNGSGVLSWTSKTDATVGANTIGITELNVSDGSAGQYLTTNGSGVLSFATDSTNVGATSVGGDVTGTVSNIQIAANAVGASEIAANAVGSSEIATNAVGITELNVSDGTDGQVLKTNGSGTLSFTTIAPGVSEATATSKAVTMAIALG